MSIGVDDHEPRSTPKLSLSKLPCKPKQPIQMLTPPLHPSLSIPFQWEEAPGKPRFPAEEAPTPSPSSSAAAKSKSARCLELPPRLMLHDDAEFTIMPSPDMVLGGPYAARSLSLACNFSFRRGPGSDGEGGFGRPARMGGCGSFGGSRRWRSWGSFKFREEERGSFDLSQKLGDFFMSEKKNVKKMGGIRRVRSLLDLSAINSNLLDMHARFKQAIPWRRRR